MSAQTATLSTVHSPLGTHGLWNHKGLELPAYIQNVAKGIMKSGTLDKGTAIEYAIGTIKRWATGGGNVTPAVRAASVKALAEWEALKATHGGGSEHSRTGGDTVDLSVVETSQGAQFFGVPIGTTIQAKNVAPNTPVQMAPPPGPSVSGPQSPEEALGTMPDGQLLQASVVASSLANSYPEYTQLQQQLQAEATKRGLPPLGTLSVETTQGKQLSESPYQAAVKQQQKTMALYNAKLAAQNVHRQQVATAKANAAKARAAAALARAKTAAAKRAAEAAKKRAEAAKKKAPAKKKSTGKSSVPKGVVTAGTGATLAGIGLSNEDGEW
jgi:hypothetical protein